MRPRRRALLRIVACMSAIAAILSDGRASTTATDLGDPRPRVAQMLGNPLRTWRPSQCPKHEIELRRSGKLWLKLAYGPDDRVRAAGVFRLAREAPAGAGEPGRVELHWPGLAPGSDGRSAYPPATSARPLLSLIGAKQWLWIEQLVEPSTPAGRSRYFGGVVVDDASDFAGGEDFPVDVAQAVTETPMSSADWAEAEMTQPLMVWRRRPPPNVYIETLDTPSSPTPGCDALTLVLPEFTDFKL